MPLPLSIRLPSEPECEEHLRTPTWYRSAASFLQVGSLSMCAHFSLNPLNQT